MSRSKTSVWTFFFLVHLLVVTTIFGQPANPAANPKAALTASQVRFTVLTPQLIRMEWSKDGTFEDRASLVFVNRNLPVPDFSTLEETGWTILETRKLVLRYKKGGGQLGADNLQVIFDINGKSVTWHPGIEDKGNLGGTIRTLDGVKGSTSLESGLLSRDGWVVVDDSERPLFDGSEWPWVLP